MKKIMFNNKYGLTRAVLEERKTQTRRIATRQQMLTILGLPKYADYNIDELAESCAISCAKSKFSPFVVGEEVAVAQSYNEICYSPSVQKIIENELGMSVEDSPGYRNKMFVRADLMHNHIKITNVRIEHLQDISNDDCLKEGISRYKLFKKLYYGWNGQEKIYFFDNIRLAFAYLIDKISGKGTWNSNPYVFVYDFELIK